jgi:hypothetical protein
VSPHVTEVQVLHTAIIDQGCIDLGFQTSSFDWMEAHHAADRQEARSLTEAGQRFREATTKRSAALR